MEKVQCKKLGLRGRIDDHGLLHGKPCMVEFKTGSIQVAVKYQLCLGGHLLQPGTWFHRYAVQLKADGTYKMKHWPLITWPHDLATALACVRVAQAKVAELEAALAEAMPPVKRKRPVRFYPHRSSCHATDSSPIRLKRRTEYS